MNKLAAKIPARLRGWQRNDGCHRPFNFNRHWLLAGWLALVLPALASDDMLVYSDRLNNGWDIWGGAPNYFTNNPVHSGTNAICIAPSAGNQPLYLHQDDMDTTIYTNLVFWINGGASGGQSVQVNGYLNGVAQPKVSIGINGKLPTNSWLQVSLSLETLGCANKTNFDSIKIWSSSGSVQSNFFVDDISLVAAPPPALVHVELQATQAVRIVDARLFGINTAAWDGALDTTNTLSVLNDMNNQALRWPGGNWGNDYHWTNEPWMTGDTSARNWGSFSSNFIHVATNTGAQVFIICNYGSSTPEEAAWGVRMFNITNQCAFKYWEVGNENYGSWQTDNNTNAPWLPHDPWTYAMRFTNYYAQMKAADPAIKIGAVVLASETTYSNNATHFAVNPRTGVTNYGWTPIVLSTLKSLDVTPDFVIEHKYAPGNGDTYNLLDWTRTWAGDAATLRQMLNDYLGSSVAPNVELVSTEFGPDDKQWVSLVGGLFYADSIGQIMQTEFNGLLWWDLRNGTNVITNPDNALYGWRTNSAGYFITDQGCVYGNAVPPNRYPSFYCMKLMQYFARGGDTVVAVTNDYELLGTYAVRRTNGSLALLVINKSSSSDLTAVVNLGGYLPATNAVVYSYGMPQDNAARTGVGSMDILQANFTGAGLKFTNTFAPYSATVLVFNQPPGITAQPANVTVVQGSNPGFSVTARGTAPLSYQWYFNTNTVLAGATNATLTLTNVQPANAGNYSVVVTNVAGSVTSSDAVLTVSVPPMITAQPANVTIIQGGNATFSATVSNLSTQPLSYQWWLNATNLLLGATNATLTLMNVQPANAGSYSVVVTNVAGSVTSSNAVLTVNGTSPPVLAPVSLTAQAIIFQLQGQSGAKYVLWNSTNLTAGWQPVSTNTLSVTTMNFTNTISGSQQFWRAKWLP